MDKLKVWLGSLVTAENGHIRVGRAGGSGIKKMSKETQKLASRQEKKQAKAKRMIKTAKKAFKQASVN